MKLPTTMKKMFLLLVLPCIIAFSGCNSETSSDDTTEPTVDRAEYLRQNRLKELDLAEYDLPLIIDVPDSTVGELFVEQNALGGVDIMVGMTFQIQITGGEGDIASRKTDIEGDDVYKAEYLIDEETALLYKREIPESGLEPEFHFFVVIKTGGSTFEVQDIEGETFSEKAAQRMFDIAKAIQVKPQS